MTREEKIQKILHALSNKAGKLAVQLKKLERGDMEDGMTGIGVFLVMIDAKEIADALEVLHKEMNLI